MAIFSNVEHLKMWVHKILPLVYDDSMSYYETLCKVVAKLNEVVTLSNEQTDYLNNWLSSTEQSLEAWKDDTETTLEEKINTDLGAAIDRLETEFADELLDAEGMIYGTQNDVPVEQGSEYYENNAEYFRDQSAESAQMSKNYANGGSSHPSPIFAFDNAKYFRERAEAWANGEIYGQEVTSQDESYENNSKYYMDQAKEAALTFVPDPTLSEAGRPADAKATGDAVADLKSATNILDDSVSDLFPLKRNPVYKASFWKTGYYKPTDGTYETWTRAICTKDFFTAENNDSYLYAATSGDCYIAVCEYDSSETWIATYGRISGTTVPTTTSVKISMIAGHKYTVSVGVFESGTASSKLTDAFINTLTIDIYSTTDYNYRINWNFTNKWQAGFYNSSGVYETWDKAIVNKAPFLSSSDSILYCKSITGKGISIVEYDSSGTYIQQYGSTLTGAETNELTIQTHKGYLYNFVIGRFPNGDASTYITDEYMSTVVIQFTSSVNDHTLQPTGDTTDRTKEIRALLYTYGEAKLEAGDYYISNLVMPVGTTLSGVGEQTKIHFISGDGVCIEGASDCTFKDFSLWGDDTDLIYVDQPDLPAEGTRIGIRYYSTSYHGCISNVHIKNFDKAGIYIYYTGTSVRSGKNISNCFIANCYVGLDLNKHAEFYRVTNVSCTGCHIGCRNNGGNNAISNCSFSANNYGLYMYGDSNDSHGQIVSCIMQHDRLAAIYLDGIDSGEIFSACNIDPNDATGYAVQAVSAHRVVFTGCNFMGYSAISITGGGLIMFIGCNMRDFTASHYTSDNNKVKFINCYNDSGTLIDPTT